MLNPLEREQLLRRWEEIETELGTLADVPAGRLDPAERERRLLEAQDVIECLFAWHFKDRDPACGPTIHTMPVRSPGKAGKLSP
jgi:hypothetical protein